MNKPKISIIGMGMVGSSLQFGFAQIADFKIYDKNPTLSINTMEEVGRDGDYIFLCVPSPMKLDTGECDTSIIDSILKELSLIKGIKKKIIIIKSTVPPGTTEMFKKKYKLRIIHNPEFLTARSYLLDFINSARIVLGGDKKDCKEIEKLYRLRFPNTPIYITDSITAETVKYTANTFFTTKVLFFNEIYELCQKLKISYDDVIKMTLADGRIGNSHYQVPGHDGDLGVGGLCFPKDSYALINKADSLGVDMSIIKAVMKKNEKVRKNKDWLKIQGAISNG
jgi:UDPglucose 6-dehydrogenase